MRIDNEKIKKSIIYILAFILPIIIIASVFLLRKIGINSNRTILFSDMFSQYIGYFGKLKDVLSSDGSIFYAFNKSIGGNTIGLFAYYLASPLNLIILLFPKELLANAILTIYLIKIGICSLTLAIYINKVYKKNDYSVLIFSLCYGLMSYNIVFHMNVMWIDGVMLLPLIALGIENIINKNKYKLYIASLFLAIISNYYIAYMICIFSVLYFIYKGIIYKRVNGKNILGFIGSSLIAGGLSGYLLIPVVLSLMTGKASLKNLSDGIYVTESIFSTLSKTIIGSYDYNQILSGPANIFCGVIITVFLLLYFINEKIGLRAKLLSAVFIFILFLSFTINIFELLWHGFNYPVGFEYRNSFLFCFLIIILAYEAWINIDNIKIKDIIISLFICLALDIVILLQRYSHVSVKKIAISFLFVLIYSFIFILFRKVSLKRSVINFLCIIIVICELSLNIYLIIINNIYISQNYVKQYIEDLSPIVEDIKKDNDNFYRTEMTFNNTLNDSMLLNFNGLTHSSSTNEKNTMNIVDSLGYKTASTCEIYNQGSTIPVDSILGIRKLISVKNPEIYSCYDHLENQYYNVIKDYEDYVVYENPYALPIAFMVNDNLKTLQQDNIDNLFDYTGSIFDLMLNKETNVYNKLEVTDIKLNNVEVVNEFGENLYTKIDEEKEASIDITIRSEDSNPVYLFFKSNIYEDAVANSLNGIVNSYSAEVTSSGGAKYAQFTGLGYNIQFIGSYNDGEEIKVKIKLVRSRLTIKEIQVYSCNMNNFEKVYGNLSLNTIENTDYKDGYVKGDVTVTADKTLLCTSIPYDEGWILKVDGKDCEYIKILNGFIGVELEEGQHNIEFKYKLPGFKVGLSISIISLIILVCIGIYNYKKKRIRKLD